MKFTFQMKLHESLLCFRVGQALAHYKVTPGCRTGEAGTGRKPWNVLVKQEQLQNRESFTQAEITCSNQPPFPSHFSQSQESKWKELHCSQ